MSFRNILFLLGILASGLCCAQEELPPSQEEIIIETILHNASGCVKQYSEEKIYLNEEKIRPTNEGLFLILNENGDVLLLPSINSDQSGCFVKIVRNSRISDFNIWKECRLCGYPVLSGAFKCGNPNCPSNRPKK